jgi:CheY-like chemotaxis protein
VGAFQDHDRNASQPPGAPDARHPARQLELAYVLVADGDAERTATALNVLKPFRIAVLVARDGPQALDTIRRFGSPMLLLIDISLPGGDGFEILDAARVEASRRTEIVAWTPPQFPTPAAERLARLNARMLGPTAAKHGDGDSLLTAAIEEALLRVAPERVAAAATAPHPSSYVDRLMRGLAESARLLCGTSGAAIYLKALGETRFRAFVTWTSDTESPESPYYMPRIFDWVLETGESLVLPALDVEQLPMVTSTAPDTVRGLVAVPIVSRDRATGSEQAIGTICVFDVRPLRVDAPQIDALKALGRNVPLQPVDNARRDGGRTPGSPALPPEAAAGVPNDLLSLVLDRHHGELAVAREVARARRERSALSTILFGVDPPAQIDEFTARASRNQLAKVLTRALRESDLVIDWARHEFVTLLPGLAAREARLVAERVRAAMQVGARSQTAVSAGVEEVSDDEPFEAVVDRARLKVRTARERGHNRVA